MVEERRCKDLTESMHRSQLNSGAGQALSSFASLACWLGLASGLVRRRGASICLSWICDSVARATRDRAEQLNWWECMRIVFNKSKTFLAQRSYGSDRLGSLRLMGDEAILRGSAVVVGEMIEPGTQDEDIFDAPILEAC